MVYPSILDRSFSKHDRKKLTYGVSVGCLIMVLGLCTLFKPNLNHIEVLNSTALVDFSFNKVAMTKERNPYQYNFRAEQTSIGNSTEEASSLDLKAENLEAVPNISEQKPTHTKTKQAGHARNISQLEYSHVQSVKPDKISKTSEAKQSNAPPDEFNPMQNISRTNSEAVQSGDFILNPSISETVKAHTETEKINPICDTSQPRADVCEMSGDIRVDGVASTVFLSLPNTPLLLERSSWSIKPYARKAEKTAMGLVTEFEVKIVDPQYQSVPHCKRKHTVAGILFSTSGYSGNHFHAFTDILIPLYLTSREFNGEVKFLVTNHEPQWIKKYIAILQKLSRFEVIDIDKEKEVHCFPKMMVGLKVHKELDINPSRSQQSMKDFRNLLREAYSLKKQRAVILNAKGSNKIPRLLIISRRRTRSFLNEDEIINMSRNLGFEVIKAEANQDEAGFARIVNTCDVMMGVHGAGLTNIVFLPEKAVFIQILPLGEMNWMAKTAFGEPSKSMNLRYLEYKIDEDESSLIQQYPLNHPVLRDPHSISEKGWLAFKKVYMDKQNVKLNVDRFRGTLLDALKLLRS